jgi:hypothetical protein
MGPPMAHMLDGKQCIAFTGGRGMIQQGFNLPPPPPEVITAATAPPPLAVDSTLPRLYVYTLDAKPQP